ncbi:MAG: glycosyltransferase family 39 protein [Planctomycetota bacterium]
MILVTLGLLLSFAIGALVVWMLAPRPQSPVVVVLQLALALGIGLALTTLTHFIALHLFNGSDARLLLLDAAMLIGLCVVSMVTNRSGPSEDMGAIVSPADSTEFTPRASERDTLLHRIILAGTVIACICAATSALSLFIGRPHGNWDAWAMWNMRARFLFLAGPDWRLTFGEEMTGVHPDYPLLQPLVVSRLWVLLGDDSTIIPRLTSSLFTLATAVVLFTSVARLRGMVVACVALTILVSSPVVAEEAASQFADMPVAFYFLAATVALTSAVNAKFGINRLLALAGLCAGCAAWTKNEGVLFTAALLVSTFVVMCKSHGLRRAIKSVIVVLAGASPMLLLVAAAKLSFSWKNDLFHERGMSHLLALLTDASRYRAFGHWFAELLPGIISPWMLSLMALLIVMSGWTARSPGHTLESIRNPHCLAAALTLTLVALGYTLIYLTTPHDIGWHLRTSLSRLILHLWPSLLFVIFSGASALRACPQNPVWHRLIAGAKQFSR